MMTGWMNWLQGKLNKVTEPISDNQNVARKEFLTRVILTLGIVFLLFIILLVLGLWALGLVEILPESWGILAIIGLAGYFGWLLNDRGYWKVSSYVLPISLLIAGGISSSIFGLVSGFILLYVLSIQITALLWRRGWQWIVLGLALILHFILGSQASTPDQVGFHVYILISALLIGVTLIQWFSLSQPAQIRVSSNKMAKNLLHEVGERTRGEITARESEENYHALVENTSLMILMMDLAGKITCLSPQVEKELDIPADDLIGHAFTSFIYPEDQAETQASFEKIEPGQSTLLEFRVVDANKKIRHIRAHSKLNVKQGKPYGVTSVLFDVTTIRKEIAALRESENRLKTILAFIQTGIVIIQAETHIISDINPAALNMLGVKREDIVGKSCAVIFMADQEDERGLCDQGDMHQSETMLLRSDGVKEPILRTIVPFVIDGNNYRLVNFISIREQKEAEEALRASMQRYQILAQHIPDGVVNLFDPEMRYVLADGEEYRKQGIDPTTLLGLKVGEEVNEPAKPNLEAQIKDALAGNRTHLEVEINGQFYLYDALPVKDEDGKISAVLRLAQNITDRKRDEKIREALYRISEAAHLADNLQELYRSVHLIISDLIPAKNLYIAIYEKASGMLRFPYYKDEMNHSPRDRPFGNGLTEYVIRTGQAQLINPTTYHVLEASGKVKGLGPPSNDWLGVPLVSKSEIMGVLAVQTYTEGEHYFPSDRNILMFVSTQIALVIARKQAEEAEKHQRQLAEALRESTATLNSTLELDAVLDRILENIGKVVPHDAVNIMLVEQGIARVTRHKGYDERGLANFLDSLIFSVSDTPNLLRMMKTGLPDLIPDLAHSPDWIFKLGFEWSKSYAGVPIMIKNELVGFINLDSTVPGFFTPAHADTLRVFADQAAIALENARLYTAVGLLAIVDDLTGLYNRRGLFELGEREIERARRFQRPLCALFIDIDYFKRINDTYGHFTGDEVLRFLGRKLRENLREVDLIGRYGGEEFVILLPETDLETGLIVAERLRVSVQNNPVTFSIANISFTISIGLVLVNPAVRDMASVCELADKALYLAKRKGRNRVEVVN